MRLIKKLSPYLKSEMFLIILSLLFAIIAVGSKMAIPYYLGVAIDKIIVAVTYSENVNLSYPLLLVLILIIIGTIFRYLFELLSAHVSLKVSKRIRDDIFHRIMHTPFSYLDQHQTGDILLRITNDVDNVENGLTLFMSSLFEGVVQILITIFFMVSINIYLALATIILTPISIIVSNFISKHNFKYYQERGKMNASLSALSLNIIDDIEDIKVYNLEEEQKQRFDEYSLKFKEANFKATFAVSWINPSTRLVNNIIYAILAFLGVIMIIYKDNIALISTYSIGGLSAILAYAYQYMSPFNEISNVASEITLGNASFDRIKEILDLEADIDEGTLPLEENIHTIKGEGIHFGYVPNKEIIHDFSFTLNKGEKLAIVGPTGSGKTTIINLLLRFYDPNSGNIVINDIRDLDIPKKTLRSKFNMVLQDTYLFKGSIRDNIAFGKEDASFDEVVNAAKRAHADTFINQLKDGYDTLVSEASLSKGQMQLLCLARIMLLDKDVIILDEATSNIDLRTELLLSQSMDELLKEKSAIIVAHRLSTIINSDKIIVLKDGSIVECGDFKTLYNNKSLFREIYDSQLVE